MNSLTRWDPFRDMLSMRNALDRLVESTFLNPETWREVGEWNLALDVAETGEEYLVKASVAGIHPNDLEITYNNNLLTIKGEVKAEAAKPRRISVQDRKAIEG